MDVEKKTVHQTNKLSCLQTHCLNFHAITGVVAIAQADIAVVIWLIFQSYFWALSPKITQGGYLKWLKTVRTYQDCQDLSPE